MAACHPIPTDPRFINLMGGRFGRLKVVGYAGRSPAKKHRWLCRCGCGATLTVQGTNLKNGHQRSCGCRTTAILTVASRRNAAARKARLIAERNHPGGRITLNNGMVCRVDRADFPLVRGYVWYHHTGLGDGHYARAVAPDGKQVLMHTLLMGRRKGFVIDHRDGNGLNNRRANLRWATRSGNATNSSRRRKGYRGVMRTPAGRWQASIVAGARRDHLGTFDDARSAALAYDAAARRLHGEFARPNFPVTSHCG